MLSGKPTQDAYFSHSLGQPPENEKQKNCHHKDNKRPMFCNGEGGKGFAAGAAESNGFSSIVIDVKS
jgi:hypothetical protein